MIQYRLYALAPETAGKSVGFGIRAKERQEKAEIYHVEKRGKKLAQKRKKIGIAAAAVIVAAAGSTLIYYNLPQTKVEKAADPCGKIYDGNELFGGAGGLYRSAFNR